MHDVSPPVTSLSNDRQDLLLRVASYAVLGLATAIAVAHAAITGPVVRTPPVIDRVVSSHSCSGPLITEAEFEDWGRTLLARRAFEK